MSCQNKKVGIMGGTFNPFHNGHLQLALQAHRQFELSKVLVMPSGTPAEGVYKGIIQKQACFHDGHGNRG